ncbi:tRNA1(Val) (adenine(37)-N6)-methyltransferase [Arcobacter sp.]|uniref:tRNA1(Val) (adenine(37)-N6)-methyltransferase n=1 Tax=Arcobacter sp. TaxID=1872629 RepID=UPI003C77B535
MLLYQPQDGYCYNSDTHFLHHFINTNLKIFKNIKGELLDIGSGSGILGLLVARDNPRLNLNQCEVQDKFQELTKINSKNNKIESKIYKGKYQDISFDKTFDICVSNPPFYHTNVVKTENENIKIARYNDSMPLVDFISKTSKVLNQNGKFFFCYDVKQLNDIMHLLNEYKLNIESMQFVYPKLGKDATLVLIYARKNSKSLMRILSPLIVFDEKDFTKEVQDIYKVSSTHSIKVDI